MKESSEGNRTGITLAPYRDFDYPFLRKGERAGVWPRGTGFFRVEELQLYPFSGVGEHAALVVEKVGVSTRDLALAVAQVLGITPAAIGYAGMKDKDATAVQAFTVTVADEKRVAEAFGEAGAKVLSVSRHGNKLRLGHLAGNRFSIFLKDGDGEAAREALAALSRSGVPNWFGPQRFGAEGKNAFDGFRALTGKKRFGGWKHDLAVSALQSLIFNEVLARRIEKGEFGLALVGDVLQKTASGGLFICEDAETDQKRCEDGEICATGPLHGKKMKYPLGVPGEAEAEVLAAFSLEAQLFGRETGARRAFAFYPAAAAVRPDDGGIWLDFAAPAGCFATSVVREVAASGVFRV